MDDAVRNIRYPIETPPGIGEAHEVAEGVLWLRLPLPMALDHVNVFALDDGDGWTLIDTGIGTKRAQEAMEAALAGPLKGKPVRPVLAQTERLVRTTILRRISFRLCCRLLWGNATRSRFTAMTMQRRMEPVSVITSTSTIWATLISKRWTAWNLVKESASILVRDAAPA